MRPKESEEYWRSEVPLETLKARAQLLRTIRNFFESVQVLEVETPILASRTVTDVHIDSFEVTPFDYERSLQTEGLPANISRISNETPVSWWKWLDLPN
jgi:elongation factor P--beta-lysine ligase